MSVNVVRFPGRFRQLADVYARGRPPYPALLARRVAALLGLDGRQDVLDLGTGPGFLALDFHPFARRVVAVDPEPEMLRVAEAAARAAGATIRFIEGSSATLERDLGWFHAVTIGRAFHWMDRAATLRTLDGMVAPGGAIVLFSEFYPAVPMNSWYPLFKAVVDAYAVEDPARDVLTHNKDHEAVLLNSPFRHLERVAVLEPRITPIERVVDRALSFARAWDGTPGLRADRLAADVHAAIEPFAREGGVHEIIEGTALVARRSREVEAE